jgi:hypothetical protein
VYRASSVINKLRAKGVPIETRMEQHPETGKRFGVYYIDVLDRAMRGMTIKEKYEYLKINI